MAMIPEGFEPEVSWRRFLETHQGQYAHLTGARRKRVVDAMRAKWWDRFVRQPIERANTDDQAAYNQYATTTVHNARLDRQRALNQQAAFDKWAKAKFKWEGGKDQQGIAERADADLAYKLSVQRAGLDYDQALAEVKAMEPIAKKALEDDIDRIQAGANQRGMYRSNVRARDELRRGEDYQRQLDAFARQKKNLSADRAFAESAAKFQKESAHRYASIGEKQRAYEKWLNERGPAPLRPTKIPSGNPQLEPYQPLFAAPRAPDSVRERAQRAGAGATPLPNSPGSAPAGSSQPPKPRVAWKDVLRHNRGAYANKTGAARRQAVGRLRTKWRSGGFD